MTTPTPGQSVRLPGNRVGIVIDAPFLMPGHTLILFADGDRRWVLTEILEAIALSTGRNLSQVMQDAVAGYLDENPHSLLARVEAVERAIAFLSIEPKLSQK